MTIIGIDPGLATVGYGVIEVKEGKSLEFEYVDHGTVETVPEDRTEERLRKLNNRLSKLIKKYQAEVLAVEKLFFFRNMKTALPVSQAKGVIMMTAAKNRIPVQAFTPLQVKVAVADYGRAEKEKVQQELKKLLDLDRIPEPDDASDALGVAICCARELKKEEE